MYSHGWEMSRRDELAIIALLRAILLVLLVLEVKFISYLRRKNHDES